MYLLDTNVVSELRKGARADAGVRRFFAETALESAYLSVITIGELRAGAERIRLRNDSSQAERLERWLASIVAEYADAILPFDAEIAELWGHLLARLNQNPVDKQIAATALMYGLTVVTRNTRHMARTGVELLNPFAADQV